MECSLVSHTLDRTVIICTGSYNNKQVQQSLTLSLLLQFTLSHTLDLTYFLSSGLNVLISGGVDDFGISNSAYPLLIPAFVSTLILHQPQYPFPPDPQVYVGEYALDVIGTTITVTEYKNQLRLTSQGMTGFLAYREPLMFQVGLCCITCEHKTSLSFL